MQCEIEKNISHRRPFYGPTSEIAPLISTHTPTQMVGEELVDLIRPAGCGVPSCSQLGRAPAQHRSSPSTIGMEGDLAGPIPLTPQLLRS